MSKKDIDAREKALDDRIKKVEKELQEKEQNVLSRLSGNGGYPLAGNRSNSIEQQIM